MLNLGNSVTLSTQVYKWVFASIVLWVPCDQIEYQPEKVNILLSSRELQLIGRLAHAALDYSVSCV